MIKNFGVFFLCLLTLNLGACARKHSGPQTQAQAPVVAYANWQIEKRVFKENSEGEPQYRINVEYPEITGYPDTASARQLNKQIYSYVKDRIDRFKQSAPRESFDYSDYPPEFLRSVLNIRYSATLLKPRGYSIVSLRFETIKRLQGEATSLHFFSVINYDLSTGKMLSLDSLFRPDSPYLETISNQCTHRLRNRFTSGMPWMPWNRESNLPQEENFRIWNLEKKGLAITFQQYQVTPYSSEPQKILIPYYRLRPVLSPDSPVSAYAYM